MACRLSRRELKREAREMFAELHAGDVGGDGLELAAHFLRQVRLHVPHVQVAGTAVEKHKNARIRVRCDTDL